MMAHAVPVALSSASGGPGSVYGRQFTARMTTNNTAMYGSVWLKDEVKENMKGFDCKKGHGV